MVKLCKQEDSYSEGCVLCGEERKKKQKERVQACIGYFKIETNEFNKFDNLIMICQFHSFTFNTYIHSVYLYINQ